MFEDRNQAGELLGEKLLDFQRKSAVVLAIPRGGVVVGKAVAEKLEIPLGVIVTKKIGAPDQEELAIGAVGPEGEVVLEKALVSQLGVEKEALEKQITKARKKVRKYKLQFKDKITLKNKIVILVDDGIATGATIKAAIKYLNPKETSRVILAVPVAPREALTEFENLVDKFVVLLTPPDFKAVGQFYKNFPQVTDKEVLQLLQK